MKIRGRVMVPENEEDRDFLLANIGERIFVRNIEGEKVEVILYAHRPSRTVRFIVYEAVNSLPSDLVGDLLSESTDDAAELLNDAILLINT